MKRFHPEPVDNGQLSRPNHSIDLDRDGLVTPMSDGVRLRSDLYLPAGPGPWPVLLERTPYNKESSVEVTQAKSPEYFASRGYAGVVQDTRGRFKSEGEFYPFRDDGWGEHRDGYDTVEWLAEQTWCDGKIGTLGGSYAGHTQYAMAPTAPPHLAAQFARHSISDFHDGWIFRGLGDRAGHFSSRTYAWRPIQTGGPKTPASGRTVWALDVVRVSAAPRSSTLSRCRSLVLRLAGTTG